MTYILSQSKNSYSVLGLQKLLNINLYKTTWMMAHKIRKALAERDARYKLAGLIEMDDGYFGQRKVSGKRGRGSENKSKVIVAVKLDEWENPLFANRTVVPHVDKENIANVIHERIQSDSKVKTDGWPAFNAIKKQGLQHQKDIIRYPGDATKALPWVHILISNCKAVLRGTHHGVSKKHLHRYLAEFCYRFNRRFWPQQIFERMSTSSLSTNTVTLAELMT